MPPSIDVADYCRDIETYLCRKNDGHLIRIVGPSFDVVSGWAARGVPLKVALGGIDRYFERYYRKGPRRRPAKIDFCEADVLDLFDEWRRATGVTVAPSTGESETTEPVSERRSGPSLPDHLQRVLGRLSTLRASGALTAAADRILDAVSAELDAARARSGGVRGDERRALIARLDDVDGELLALARSTAAPDVLAAAQQEALSDLSSFRATMAPEAFERAVDRATTRALRDRLGLPVVAFS
jgi:hypothetical protein